MIATPESKEMFRALANDPRFLRWLAAERAATVRHLTNQAENVGVFRSQGRLQLLDELEAQSK